MVVFDDDDDGATRKPSVVVAIVPKVAAEIAKMRLAESSFMMKIKILYSWLQ